MNTKTIIAMALTAILTSGAIALAGPIGPSAQSSTNPIRAFSATGFTGAKQKQDVYTVPKGKVFIITDVVLGSTSAPGGHNAQVIATVWVGGTPIISPFHRTNGYNSNIVGKEIPFQSGYPVQAGSTIKLSSNQTYTVLTITGYLARP